MKKACLLSLTFLILTACGMENHANTALERKNIHVDVQKPIPHCYGYGCAKKAEIELSQTEWAKIQRTMTPLAKTAEKERKNIRNAIAAFEQIMGEKAGTHTDKAGTFKNMGADGPQHDCVDESMNTTIYLKLLAQKQWLLHHNIEGPTVRLPVIHAGRWPHQTAVIREKDSESRFAVDSWFHDNGHPPEIVPLPEWKNGWKPLSKD